MVLRKPALGVKTKSVVGVKNYRRKMLILEYELL